MKNNFILERKKKLHFNVDQRKSYENLTTIKQESVPSGPLVGVKVIEEWLNETLSTVDDFKIARKMKYGCYFFNSFSFILSFYKYA